MSNKPNEQDPLRVKAEAEFLRAPMKKQMPRPAENLQHELQIHQIELEMQNETLRQFQISLEKSRDRYVDFYDFAPTVFITLSRKALITEINLTGAKQLGKERNKLVNRRFSHFVSTEDQDRWCRFFVSVLNNAEKQSCELRLQRSDGTRFYAQLDCLAMPEKDGKVSEVRIVLSDISERKRIEVALRESEERRHLLEQQEIVQTSLDGFWVVRASDGKILEVNDTFCKMMGYSREEILSKKIQDLDAIETPEETEARIKKIQEVGYDRFETRHRHKLGHLVDFEVSVSHSEVNGGINFAFFRDITERNRMLGALKKSEENYRVLFENSRDALLTAMAEPPLTWLSVNQSAMLMFGAESRAELIGLRPWDISPHLQPDGSTSEVKAQQMVEIAKQNGSNLFEWVHQRLDGRVFPAEVLLTKIEQNSQVTIQATIRDITERKRAEDTHRQSRNEMEGLQKMHVAAQTAAAIAHELNQPLLAIATYSEAALMLMKAENPNLEKIGKAVAGSEKQAQRAGQSIRELLEFLSVKEFQTEAFDLNEEIIKVMNTARSGRDLYFYPVLLLEEKLPLVRANRIHVQKALFNLLYNSIDAMQEAGVLMPIMAVTVCTKTGESVAQVTIQDNGPGIKKEDIPRLFEPFYTTKAKGIGMGLAISRSLIEENGGQLWVDPQEGPGATFHLTLPFAT